MLVDQTDGKLAETKTFAETIGKLNQLEETLEYLSNYGQSETRCLLSNDFAPHSFYFVMQRKINEGEWVDWFNGGLIFHGNHDNYGGGVEPTYSSCVTRTDGWSVHT